jgi:hypothetical protein
MDPSELLIGSARGARGSKSPIPLQFQIIRSLTPDDLPDLVSPPPLGSTAPTVQSLRASHHQLAQLLARGTAATEASLITGYSISRISILKSDPTFAELLASYAVNRELVFADTLDRMRILGLSTLDELQDRLEADPARWSNRELMEMAELMLVKPRIATPMGQASALGGSMPGHGASSGGPGVTVNVKFVTAETPTLVIEGETR